MIPSFCAIRPTDAILILGRLQDVEADHTYDTSKMEAFLVPAGTAVIYLGENSAEIPNNLFCNVQIFALQP